MNTSKTLLAILLEELPKRGGWPDGVAAMAQDASGAVQNYSDTYDIRIDSQHAFGRSRIVGSYSIGENEVSAATDRLTAIITRDQYESALIDRPEYFADAEGWTPWCGGECPVSSHTSVDVKFGDGSTDYGHSADSYTWKHGALSLAGLDIIAYRLHQPQEADSRANDNRLEADLNDCIGQTPEDLEQLTRLVVEDIHYSAPETTVGSAYKIAVSLIDAGYRKQ